MCSLRTFWWPSIQGLNQVWPWLAFWDWPLRCTFLLHLAPNNTWNKMNAKFVFRSVKISSFCCDSIQEASLPISSGVDCFSQKNGEIQTMDWNVPEHFCLVKVLFPLWQMFTAFEYLRCGRCTYGSLCMDIYTQQTFAFSYHTRNRRHHRPLQQTCRQSFNQKRNKMQTFYIFLLFAAGKWSS